MDDFRRKISLLHEKDKRVIINPSTLDRIKKISIRRGCYYNSNLDVELIRMTGVFCFGCTKRIYAKICRELGKHIIEK